MFSKRIPLSTPKSSNPSSPPLPSEDSSWVRVAIPQRCPYFDRKGMSLPPEYIEEINVLNEKVSNARPKDVLQFCANHFYTRLEFERREHLSRKAMSFAPESSRPFPSLSPFDGTRDSIQEEDEDIHSPSVPSFRPQYSMGGSGGGGSGRRSHSPSGGGGGGGSPFQMQPPRSGSPFLSPSSSSHLSPNSAQGEFPSNYNRNRRTSVSAESLAPTSSNDEWSPPVHPKTQEQITRLKAAVSNNFLFSHLDEEQFSQVLLALVEKPIPGRDMRVITQGDVGDYFYVVEKGEFDVYVNSTGTMMPGPEGMGKKVLSYGPGGSFGELALMYNAPRAATVVSTSSQNILWALDRVTFRRILMENTFKRRRMYEAFLEEVSLLSYLVPSERSKIADSLDTDTYEQGETIIREGDAGDKFYFIEQGTAEVHKSSVPGGSIRTLKKGDYFGELALLNDAPRAASIIAKSKVKVAFLGKDGFQRLLGPVADIMRRNDPRLAEEVDPLQAVSEATGPHDPAGPTRGAASKDKPLAG